MPIPETQFEGWHKQGASVGSKQARKTVKRIFELDRSPIEQQDCTFNVFLQGSYKNSTHTRGSSDVDILVKLESAWKKDLSALTPDEKCRYQENTGSTDYGYEAFSQDVWSWTQKKFNGVSRGNKAIKIDSDRSGRLSVDVDIVPCGEYRVYESYPEFGDPQFVSGMHFTPWPVGSKIVNFPTEHYQNGCQKHSNYKETVRIFKNARSYYNDNWNSLFTIDAPSYFVECLIYNVPKRVLKHSNRSDRFREILEYLQASDTDLSQFTQVSEMEPLFGTAGTQWSISEAETMLSRLTEMWNDWYDKNHASLLH